MALTLGDATLISDAARNAQADAFDTLINGGTTQSLRLLERTAPGGSTGGTGVLVTWTLNATAAFGAASAGEITLADLPLSQAASAGTATVPNTYEILADSTVHWRGIVTGSDGISNGQTVNLTDFSITWPDAAP